MVVRIDNTGDAGKFLDDICAALEFPRDKVQRTAEEWANICRNVEYVEVDKDNKVFPITFNMYHP